MTTTTMSVHFWDASKILPINFFSGLGEGDSKLFLVSSMKMMFFTHVFINGCTCEWLAAAFHSFCSFPTFPILMLPMGRNILIKTL